VAHRKDHKNSNINPSFLESSEKQQTLLYPLEYYVDGILEGNKISLSRAITLIESKISEHKKLGSKILKGCLPHSGKSIRIGISGSPGVGKSTFIEALGMYAMSVGKKPAVLAIDPASTLSKGSVLGDKTRMQNLSNEKNAYIRPSSAGGELGGTQRNTKESIILCEAAGYDVILIETVGVGQAETKVHSIVDFFVLLILPGAGDELQGIKRGIVELADLILVNKADGERINLAKNTRQSYSNAIHLLGKKENNWIPKVKLVSSLENKGIVECWQSIVDFKNQYVEQAKDLHRSQQDLEWLKEQSKRILLEFILNQPNIKDHYEELLRLYKEGELNVFDALDRFEALIRNIEK
jgi:LAO/AO transport system kinase